MLSLARRYLADEPSRLEQHVITGPPDPLNDAATLKRIDQSIARGVFTSLHTPLECDSETVSRLVGLGLHRLVIEITGDSSGALAATQHLCRIRNDRPQIRLRVAADLSPEHLTRWLTLAQEGRIEEIELVAHHGTNANDASLALIAPLAHRAPWRRPQLITTAGLLRQLQGVEQRQQGAPGEDESELAAAPGASHRPTKGNAPTSPARRNRRGALEQGHRNHQILREQRPRFSVVIPTHSGSQRWLGKCLTAVARLRGPAPEVIVVIDGPAPALGALIREALPAARQLRLASNRGFAQAANAGLRSARGQLIALLNDDTDVDPHWLEAMDCAARTHPNAGSFASRVLQQDRPAVIDSAGHGLCRWGEAFEIGAGARDGAPFNRDRWVFGAPASACVYRSELIDDCGGFDDSMEAYLEDVELSLRAQLLGYPCLYVAAARVLHRGSSSYGAMPPKRVHLLARNRIHLMLRSMPQATLRTGSTATALSLVAGLVRQCLTGPAPMSALRGTLDALSAARASLAERPQSLGRRRVDDLWIRAILRSSEERLIELTARADAGHWQHSRATLCRSLSILVDRSEHHHRRQDRETT